MAPASVYVETAPASLSATITMSPGPMTIRNVTAHRAHRLRTIRASGGASRSELSLVCPTSGLTRTFVIEAPPLKMPQAFSSFAVKPLGATVVSPDTAKARQRSSAGRMREVSSAIPLNPNIFFPGSAIRKSLNIPWWRFGNPAQKRGDSSIVRYRESPTALSSCSASV